MKNKNIKKQVLLAMFIAIELMMVSIPFLGYIPIGPLRATTLHIPVILAAILLGPKQGMAVGLTFGLTSLFYNTINPSITSFVFSPFISKNMLSAVIAIVPRMVIGYVSGTVYLFLKNHINEKHALFIGSLLGALSNTILVLGGIYAIFAKSYAQAIQISVDTLSTYLISIVTTQGVLEAITGSIIVCIVCTPLKKALGE